jgi:hypothetical protein
VADPPAGPDLDAVSACVQRTLDAPSVRVRYRYDLELPGVTDEDRRQARGLRGLWRRGVGNFFNLLMHSAFAGFAEPAAGQYLVEHRGYAQLFADGRLYRGRAGRPLTALTPERPGDADVDRNLFWPLWVLSGATGARFDGSETPGRRYIVQADLDQAAAARNLTGDWPVHFVKDPPPPHPPAFTVWTDGQYVRGVRFAKQAGNDITSDLDGYGALTQLELWDFGVSVAHLDWSRLPDFTEAASQA